MAKRKKTTPKKPIKLDPVVKEAKGTKTFQISDFANFSNAAKRLSISYSELSVALGYSPQSFCKWQELKKMPYVAKLACERLLQRQRNGPSEVVIQATEATVISGTAKVKEIHPGIFVVEL